MLGDITNDIDSWAEEILKRWKLLASKVDIGW